MPTYLFSCVCGSEVDVLRTIAGRDDSMTCGLCKRPMQRRTVYSLRSKFKGRITSGGGPDRLTADMLGIPLKELPRGLRTSAADLKRIEQQPAVDFRPIND